MRFYTIKSISYDLKERRKVDIWGMDRKKCFVLLKVFVWGLYRVLGGFL